MTTDPQYRTGETWDLYLSTGEKFVATVTVATDDQLELNGWLWIDRADIVDGTRRADLEILDGDATPERVNAFLDTADPDRVAAAESDVIRRLGMLRSTSTADETARYWKAVARKVAGRPVVGDLY